MLKLLGKDKTSLGLLVNCKDVCVESDLKTGLKSLSFSFPITDELANQIQGECYIQTEDYEYIIKEVNKENNDWFSVYCKPNIENIEGKAVRNFAALEAKAVDILRLAVLDTGWTVQEINSITKRRTIRKDLGSALEVVQDVAKVFMIELEFDTLNKVIKIYNKRGKDIGAYFINQLNLKQLSEQSNTYDFITRLIPIGKDNLRIAAINNSLDYVDNFQYSNKVIAKYWEDNRYTDIASLKEDAIAKLEEFSKPRRSYSANVYTFATDVALGDTITLIDNIKNIKETQRVVKMKQYPATPEKDTIEIANKLLSFTEQQQILSDAAQVIQNNTTDSGALDANKIEGNISVEENIPNGSITTEKIDAGAITTDKLAANSVTAGKIVAGSIETDKIAAGAVTAAKIEAGTIKANSAIIEDAAITTAKIGNAQITNAKIADAAIDNAKIDKAAISTAQIQDLAVGTAQIADAAITNLKVGTAAIKSANIEDLAVTNAKIANATIETAKIKDAAITTAKIDNAQITTAKIADAQITNAKIENLAVDNAKIKDLNAGKITAGDIAADRIKTNVIDAVNAYVGTATIGAAKIGVLDAGKITTGDLTADRMKTNAIAAINASIGTATIDSAKIGTLDASKITTGSLAAAQIQANVISAINSYTGTAKIKQAQIDALTVGSANITDLSVITGKIADLAITNGKIANATIESAKIKSLDVSKLNAGTIDTAKFTIASTSGKLTISDNTITIKDAQATPKTRVQIGLDARGNYGVYVLNAAGVPIFDSDKGVLSADGLNKDVVTTDKILNGAVTPGKIQIEELWADEGFINKLKVAELDAAQIKTGKISGEVIDLAGLVTFEAFAPEIKPVFSVTGNKTYINGGMIATNTITANQIDLLSGFTVKGPDNQNSFAIASNGEIEINGWLHSSNYVPGASGYSINKDGTAELNEVKVRGTFDALDAGITNVDAAENAVRIWAGGTYENRAAAKFRVNKNGDLFATNATLSGVLYGDLVNDNLTIDNGALIINSGAETVVNINSGQTLLNTDVEIGNNNVRYSKGDKLLNLNDTDFRVNSVQGTVLIDKSSGAFGGLNIIGPSGGHHILRGSTATNKLGTLVFDSQGNQGETGDFSFTRKNHTEKCKVNVDGDLTIAERISSTVYPIEQRWTEAGTYEGLGFYVM